MPEQPTFSLGAFLHASSALRNVGSDALSLEEAASAVVGFVREAFVDKDTGSSAIALARLYVTKRSDELEPNVQDFARAAAPEAFADRNVICLTLLGTAGAEGAWNDRHASQRHKAIPLPSLEELGRSPMIAQLIEQLGIDARQVVEPDPKQFLVLDRRTYDVFYVRDALDSPYVPDQSAFVIPYGIRSVVGFGGALPDGTVFAVVLFSTLPIPASALSGFGAVALGVKVALLAHAHEPTFAHRSSQREASSERPELALARLESQVSALSQLVDAQENLLSSEALRLEHETLEAKEHIRSLASSQRALAASEARKTALLEGALDCIVGMDSQGRITEFNHAAESAFGYRRDEVVGHVLADVLIPAPMRDRHRIGLEKYLLTGEGPLVGRRVEVNALRSDGREFPVELTVANILNTDPPQFSGYLRDITERRQVDRDLAASRERLAHTARTLQTSLLPPDLPEISGIELAAAFRTLGDGYELGGDFYDAFELADGRWAVTLGDVCGKGSEAAVITALARYTLRAAAMRNPSPTAVFAVLNEALYRQHPDKFCTAVYAVVDPETGAIELGLGGHPQPFLLHADGTIGRVGTANRLLGPYPDWEGTTDTLVLEPGDVLVLYSDGLTEARSDDVFYGEERLAAALRQCHGGAVDTMVVCVEDDVLDFAGELSDDLAILAIERARDATVTGAR